MYTSRIVDGIIWIHALHLFSFEGSTEINPIVFFRKINQERRTNSSTKDDFPAPPVPVIPSTGVLQFSFFLDQFQSFSSNIRKFLPQIRLG
jgi:hypothetical protein